MKNKTYNLVSVTINPGKRIVISSNPAPITITSQSCPCDSTGAIYVISGLNDAPVGTANLLQINKYRSPSGSIITWIDNTITVCEADANIWRVFGAPFVLIDGAGISQVIPTLGALFSLFDGSKLLVYSSIQGLGITQVRFYLPGTPLNSTNLQGYDPTQIEVYNNRELGKEPAGTLDKMLNQFPS